MTPHRARALVALWFALPALLAACAADGPAAPTQRVTVGSASPAATDSALPTTAVQHTTPPATPLRATPPPMTPAPTIVPAFIPPELLGDWLQRTEGGTLAGAYQQRVYRFRPDGSYEYWNEWCPSYGECSGGYEWGQFQVAESAIAFLPQTPSTEGKRSFPYSIEPDAIGAPTLRLLTPAGVDVFYRP